MRALLLLVIALVGPTTAAQPAGAGAEGNSISVSGEAEVRVVPDEVILHLGVETGDRDLSVAKKLNDERVARALAAAQSHEIEKRHVQTDHLSIEPRYRESSEVVTSLIGYIVRRSIVITVKDTSKFERLLSALLEAGANHVHGVDFRTTELRKHRDQARLLAVKAAQEKAIALAGALGRKAVRAVSVSEGSLGWWSGYASGWGNRWGQGMTQNAIQNVGGATVPDEGGMALGQITVKASVSVVFALE